MFKVWIDEGALRAGGSLIQSSATAIHEMEFVVAPITDASVDSRWCQHEIRLAMTSGLNREGVKVLAVRVGNAPVPGELEDTFCAPLNLDDMDAGVERLAADARSHHRERRRARDAGEPLPTTGAMLAKVPQSHPCRRPSRARRRGRVRASQDHRHREDGVGRPRNDGTRGSGFYKVPLRLSRRPSSEWAQLFVQCWDRPPQLTTMHRPGIARVSGDTIVLDGTTMAELETYHAKTLRFCVENVNEQEAEYPERLRAQQEREGAVLRRHQRGFHRPPCDVKM